MNGSIKTKLAIIVALIIPLSILAREPISAETDSADKATAETETVEPDLVETESVEESLSEESTGKYLEAYQSVKENYIVEHLEIGIRVSHFTLDDSKKQEFDEDGNFTGGFLGSIDELEEEQDYVPTLYVRYNVNEYVGLEVGWDKFEVKTSTYYDTSDGDFEYSGFSLLLRGRYPNDTIFTPYGSIGWSFLSGEVDYNPEWHDNGRRNLYPDDTTAFSVGGGCEIEVARNWSIDLGARYIKADFDVEYKLAAESKSRGTFEFPLDNTTFQAGISYRF